jgi:hypothetical protein
MYIYTVHNVHQYCVCFLPIKFVYLADQHRVFENQQDYPDSPIMAEYPTNNICSVPSYQHTALCPANQQDIYVVYPPS